MGGRRVQHGAGYYRVVGAVRQCERMCSRVHEPARNCTRVADAPKVWERWQHKRRWNVMMSTDKRRGHHRQERKVWTAVGEGQQVVVGGAE